MSRSRDSLSGVLVAITSFRWYRTGQYQDYERSFCVGCAGNVKYYLSAVSASSLLSVVLRTTYCYSSSTCVGIYTVIRTVFIIGNDLALNESSRLIVGTVP